MTSPDIYKFIEQEEAAFLSDEIRVGDNWSWNFRNFTQMIFHLKHSKFFTGNDDFMRPFKNVMEPIMNLAYWMEDIEVKDVDFFIEGKNNRILSFLIKKYHNEVYVRENDLDTLFDEITESDIDYGGVLVQKTNTKKPEVFPLTTVAFCDQTNMLGGPVAFKHHFSPDGLRKMASVGWGSEKNGATISIDDLIALADFSKDINGVNEGKANKVPGKTIEVYLVYGSLPEHFLKDNDDMENWYNQIQICAFYKNKKNQRIGQILYRNKESDGLLKFHTSSPIPGCALGSSVGESMIHPQIWTNFLTIHKTRLLESASKVPLVTDDPSYTNRNQIQDMENLEITVVKEGRSINQIQTASPANIQILTNATNEWYEHAQLLGSAFDPSLGKEANSGTTFRGQERVIAQGRGSHDRKRGKRAKFIEELYRDWIIPDIKKEILGGKKFLSTLALDELQWMSEQLATNHINDKIKKSLIEGKLVSKEEQEEMKKLFKQNFAKGGNSKMLEILKYEFKDVEMRIGINISNKQKNLADLSDKVLSIFQLAFANPQAFAQAMQNPSLSKSFNDILEFSGMNQSDFFAFTQMSAPEVPQAEQQAQPPAPNNQQV